MPQWLSRRDRAQVGLIGIVIPGFVACGILIRALVALGGGSGVDTVVRRVASPSGKHVAVVVREGGGATARTGTRIMLEPEGRRLFSAESAWVDERTGGVRIQWTGDRTLKGLYRQAFRSHVEKNEEVAVVERAELPPRILGER